ncbi:hypothetical protein [Haladaptatus paucihalophilus]|uniref:hypothetical protein n=1 Tax=Haladaptatus paucihalophilus TaxID=367189 RepID=UPI0015C55F1F|nr:hypothetical protein [Haladaptatus paucihalophilus]
MCQRVSREAGDANGERIPVLAGRCGDTGGAGTDADADGDADADADAGTDADAVWTSPVSARNTGEGLDGNGQDENEEANAPKPRS